MATLTKGKTFGSTEQVTNTKLHQLVDSATIADIDIDDMATNYGLVISGGSQPSNTAALWRDTGNGNVIKYYDGSSWVELPGLDSNGFLTLSSQPAFYAYKNAGQSINNNTWTKIQMDQEAYDVGGNYDPTTNYRFTVPTGGAGKYLVIASLGFISQAANTLYEVAIYLNGSITLLGWDQIASAVTGRCNVIGILNLAAADYLECYGLHQHGSSRNTTDNSYDTYFMAHKLS